jgi:hypothetical protein
MQLLIMRLLIIMRLERAQGDGCETMRADK